MSLLSDPRSWTRSAVSTWPRFVASLLLPALSLALLVDTGSWRIPNYGIGLAAMVLIWHAMVLYVLRCEHFRAEALVAAQGPQCGAPLGGEAAPGTATQLNR